MDMNDEMKQPKKPKWITPIPAAGRNAVYRFSKRFARGDENGMSIRISADTRYRLYLNGAFVCEGPCQGSHDRLYYETADASRFLVDGENEIVVRVLHITEPVFITVFHRQVPALCVEAVLSGEAGEKTLISDESWAVSLEESLTLDKAPEVFESVAPFETVTYPERLTELTTKELFDGGFGDKWNPYMGMVGVLGDYPSYARPIPLFDAPEWRKMTCVRKGKGYIELDAGTYVTANLRFELRANAGVSMKITYAECYAAEAGDDTWSMKKTRRDVTRGVLRGPSDCVTADGEAHTYEPFWYRAFRFIRIEYTGKSKPAITAYFAERHYPLQIDATFSCSDETANRMWEISKRTLLCCMQETYVDCPHYEQQQYDMDSLLEMIYTARLSRDMRLAKKTIAEFAASQQPSGFVLANYPSAYRQIIPNFSLYWMQQLSFYYDETRDTAFVRQMLPVADRVLSLFDGHLTENGIVGALEGWQFLDWTESWEGGSPARHPDDALTVTNMLYAYALGLMGDLCRLCGRAGLGAEYQVRKQALNEAINRVFFDKEKKLYRDTETGGGYSVHTAIWAVLCDAVAGDDAKTLLARAMDGNLTGCSFSMNYFLLRALEKAGLYDAYAPRILAAWKPMLDWGSTVWCENPGDPRSECHGWSAVPIYEDTAMTLGVQLDRGAPDTVVIAPHIGALSWCRGTVPTALGKVSVALEKTGDTVSVQITSDEKINKKILLPDSGPVLSADSDIRLTYRAE